jgi:hypothetical protein
VHDRLDRPAKHTAARIDLLDRKQGGIKLGPFNRRCHARLRKQHPDTPGIGVILHRSHNTSSYSAVSATGLSARRSLLPICSDWKSAK